MRRLFFISMLPFLIAGCSPASKDASKVSTMPSPEEARKAAEESYARGFEYGYNSFMLQFGYDRMVNKTASYSDSHEALSPENPEMRERALKGYVDGYHAAGYRVDGDTMVCPRLTENRHDDAYGGQPD